MKRRGIGTMVQVLLLLFIALGLIAYPFISNYLFEHRTASECSLIDQQAEKVDDKELQEALKKAQDYNRVIASGRVQLTDPFEGDISHDEAGAYESLCNLAGDGVMGTIDIPVINVNLPIFHGTSDQVLKVGAGHLYGTSLPVGGPSTHSVITGHTGLSSAKLFTDLVQMKKDDIFFVNMLGEKLAYKVDEISVVKPDDMSRLTISSGKDYVTLLTCTPYGINSHRLLVRGERTDYKEAIKDVKDVKPQVTSKWMDEYKKALFIGLLVIYGIMMSAYVISRCRTRTTG